MSDRSFWLRRPVLLTRYILADRERPELAPLSAITNPEQFVWAILPHAARTFAACIVLLPASAALPAAVAYLYCRMLDSYEDLVLDRADREASLLAFAERFEDASRGAMAPAPPIGAAGDRDQRDRAHLLLVERAALVDQLFLSFDARTRGVIADLVRDMATGMLWSSSTFAIQGGVLENEQQLATYCRHVLGNPVVFGVRLVLLSRGFDPLLSPDEREQAMRVGEMVQLANVTRDVEKDLRRGIAYDPSLRAALDPSAPAARADALGESVRLVRERLLRMALVRAPAYARIIDAMRFPRWSLARASAVVMLLFTERYFRGSARRVGLPAWSGPDSAVAILFRGFVSAASRGRAAREVARVERAFLVAAV